MIKQFITGFIIGILFILVFQFIFVFYHKIEKDKEYLEMQRKYSWINSKLLKVIQRESQKNKVDYKLICAIIDAESQGKSRAVSKSGAIGIMQIMNFHYKGNKKDLFDVKLNIKIGIRYFAKCLKQAKGYLVYALRNYERGSKGKGYNVNYIAKIINNYYGGME